MFTIHRDSLPYCRVTRNSSSQYEGLRHFLLRVLAASIVAGRRLNVGLTYRTLDCYDVVVGCQESSRKSPSQIVRRQLRDALDAGVLFDHLRNPRRIEGAPEGEFSAFADAAEEVAGLRSSELVDPMTDGPQCLGREMGRIAFVTFPDDFQRLFFPVEVLHAHPQISARRMPPPKLTDP